MKEAKKEKGKTKQIQCIDSQFVSCTYPVFCIHVVQVTETSKVNATEPVTLPSMKGFHPSIFKWEDSSAGPTITHYACMHTN